MYQQPPYHPQQNHRHGYASGGSIHSTHSTYGGSSSNVSRHSTQRYSSQPYGHTAVPPGADPQLWQYFSNVDTDRSGSITVNELQQALVNEFDLDTVKMLMSIFDVDRSGTISYNEFAGLWKYISEWQNVFRHFDRDRSGSIDGPELSEALRSFGYNLSPNLLNMIEQKYASAPDTGYGPPPGITFDRFVRACVVVKTLTESFQRADVNRNGWVQLNYEQFMSMVLSAP
ncbi:apoptosis-linked protein [Marasmius fiardii PR-910]|nr:apoptosis-linked protein [Marasmius fiardii PR-910]